MERGDVYRRMRSYKEHHRGVLQLTVTFLDMNWVLQRQQEKVGKRWTHHKIVRMSVRQKEQK